MKQLLSTLCLFLLLIEVSNAQKTVKSKTSVKDRIDRTIMEVQARLHLSDSQKIRMFDLLYTQNLKADSLRQQHADTATIHNLLKNSNSKLAEILTAPQLQEYRVFRLEKQNKKLSKQQMLR